MQVRNIRGEEPITENKFSSLLYTVAVEILEELTKDDKNGCTPSKRHGCKPRRVSGRRSKNIVLI